MKYIKTFESHKILPSIEELDDYFLEYLDNGSLSKIFYENGKFYMVYYVRTYIVGEKLNNLCDRLDSHNIRYLVEYDYTNLGTIEKPMYIQRVECPCNGEDIYKYIEFVFKDINFKNLYLKKIDKNKLIKYDRKSFEISLSGKLQKDMIKKFNFDLKSLFNFCIDYIHKNSNLSVKEYSPIPFDF